MNKQQLGYTVGSFYDRENLVLEVSIGDSTLLTFTNEPSRSFEMEIYPPHEGNYKYPLDEGNFWKLRFEEFKKILDKGLEFLESLPSDSSQPLNYIRQQFSYAITSITDSKNTVLHIFVDNKRLLEISKKLGDHFEIEIYPPHEGSYKFPLPDGDFWKLDYLKFRAILDEGMKVLEQLF